MTRKKIVIAGTNFGGLTAAIELKELVGDNHDVIVVANTHQFLFFPSLIWFPFGLRDEKDVTFDVRPIYQKNDINFIEAEITHFEPEKNLVYTKTMQPISYDYLIIATGPKVDYDYIPGLREHAHSIIGIAPAIKTREAWNQYLEDPGPVVIASAQGTGCFGAAYEFLFNTRYQLAKHHLAKKVSLTYVTAEPFLAHFGINGFGMAEKMCNWMFKYYHIQSRPSAAIKEVKADGILLESGEFLPSKFTMVVPRFLGVDAVRNTPGLANANGFIETDDTYQHHVYKNIFAAGVTVDVKPPSSTPVPCGVPKTGWPTEQMAKLAAKNIVADIKGLPFKQEKFGDMNAYCIMDTGNMGMMIVGDHILSPRQHQFIIPGPEAHWAKIAFEKYFLYTRKHGQV